MTINGKGEPMRCPPACIGECEQEIKARQRIIRGVDIHNAVPTFPLQNIPPMQNSLDSYSREDLMMMRAQWVLRKHEKDFKDLMDCAEFNSCWPSASGAKQVLLQTREANRRAWRQVGREL